MSKLKDNLLQVAIDVLRERESKALRMSNVNSLRALTNYNLARKRAYADYACNITNLSFPLGETKKILANALLNARWERDVEEENAFQIYIKELDDANDEFAKVVKTLDSFVTYDDEIYIEGGD